jgi:type I restriction-modification system DNA methylase subunit
MPAPTKILELVELFERNLRAYKQGPYNEAQARSEFIDPFFKALGWDMTNEQGYSQAYKQVIYEDSIKVGGGTKAPDYCFRIGGIRKFFVEAKKPSVDIRGEISPAFQLRRYAWSVKMPLSILTDFEEFAVYDCRVKPDKADKPSAARVMCLGYRDYPGRWDEIAGVFSPEAIQKGSFDQYVEEQGAKRGTAEVDVALLQEIEGWREALARTIALRNPQIRPRDLNFAVQQTIDRIIFLRICEDRGIEPYGVLLGLTNGTAIYERLMLHFRHADARYNSGLFHFEAEKGRAEAPDTLTPGVVIDDKVLHDIIKRLYYPDSPYEFSQLPVEVLGQVYEQFLGKVIRLIPYTAPGGAAGHRAVVEEKPEVRKAGGVYYTPAYIVDYIVKQTVGRLLEGKALRDAGAPATGSRRVGADGHPPLRILDPACGSGSFLLGAYQYLLDWHRDRYVADGAEKWATGKAPRLYQAAYGEWKLTIAERKRILLDSIYGVDIDPQAVEVTKLSLLLKVLEGESEQTLSPQLALFPERALPDLASNIKCGNSLIGPDFYDQPGLGIVDEEEALRINAFPWEKEFAGVMAAGGFDVVIGNPPYVLLQDEFRDDAQLSYFRIRFSSAAYKVDTYHLFMERGVRLTCSGGRCSMITPANFLTNNYLAPMRRFLLENATIDQIAVIHGGVFRRVSVDNAIFVVVGGKSQAGNFRMLDAESRAGALVVASESTIYTNQVLNNPHALFTGTGAGTVKALWDRVLELSTELGAIADVNFGKQLRDRRLFPNDVIEVETPAQLRTPYRPCYTGRDVSRYYITWSGLACLDDEIARRGGCWDPEKHAGRDKLITRQIGRYPEFGLDSLGYQCLNTVFMVNLHADGADPRFVIGILNSRLLQAFWLDRFYDRRRTFPKIKGTYLKKLPVYLSRLSDPADRARHDRMVALVAQMLDLHKRLAAEQVPHVKTVLQRQIEATDRQIDVLVYELYGLTPEEIAVVEGGTDHNG